MFRAKDLTGQIFGKLTVKERLESKRGKTGRSIPQWLCICECGNEKIASSSSLTTGHCTSCGCARRNDIVGKKFGKLTVLKYLETKSFGQQKSGECATYYLCKCECGETTVVSYGNIVSGHTKSCGCLHNSAQEAVITHCLKESRITFAKEYIFADFIASSGRRFRFDFALFDSENKLLALIEYQGKQHFIEEPDMPEYGKLQREYSDKIKKEYCESKNIPLYYITWEENTEEKLKEILQAVYGNTVPSSKEKV